MSHIKPFQLLEINIISAQDLELVSKQMRTYATAWVHPKRKLSTRVDSQGINNPTWNDKFVFRVDEDFLRHDTAAVMIEIYSSQRFRNNLVGSVRVLVGNLIPPSTRHQHHHQRPPFGMRFAALQVRRPSGRPQGILNIGISVLDGSMRSMPLYTQLSASAVGFRDLMDEPTNHHPHQNHESYNQTNPPKPILRRSRSERSERVMTFDDLSTVNGSMVGVGEMKKSPPGKASSMISGSESIINSQKGKNSKKGKASSVISGAELKEKPKQKKGKKASSVINAISLVVSKDKEINPKIIKPPPPPPPFLKQATDDKTDTNNKNYYNEEDKSSIAPKKKKKKGNGGPKGSSIVNGKYTYGGGKPHSVWSDSEVGPSPSEVAGALMARDRYAYDDNQSSVLDGWSLDESVEGLRSKLERWRTELPPLYDRGYGGGGSSIRSSSQHVRRHTDGGAGSGLFSCFGNIAGYECQCVCGKPPEGGRSLSGRFQSPSASAGRSFL